MSWIFLAIAAAAFQTLRFMLQKTLSMGTLSAGGATYARFLFSAPFVAGLAAGYLLLAGMPLPPLSGLFWFYALAGGLFQILATWAVVMLFARRVFVVGITFKKTEVLQAALVGFVVLGDVVTPIGLGAIMLGFAGVLVLSGAPDGGGGGGGWLRKLLDPGAGLGLLAGAFFALSAVGYRGATLELGLDDAFLRALLTLALVTVSQTIAVSAWLRLREPGEISRVVAAWRKALWMGLAGMAGSLCWFTAFAMQNAAYVFAVGQVEVIFSIAASVLFFGERVSAREFVGIAMLSASIIVLVVAV